MIQIHNKLEAFFGFFGMLTACGFLITAFLSTPGYNPITDTVSSLGEGNGKFFFSIAFIVAGSSEIPFFLYLERELTNINVRLRKLATGFSISACICIALVGINPEASYIELFKWFHGIISFYAFIGSGIYILLYSILMFSGPKEQDFYNIEFRGYHSSLGFLVFIFLILLLILMQPMIEWILTITIISWILLTSLHLLLNKFINISITDLRVLNYDTLLEIFSNISKTLENLNLTDITFYKDIQENIKIIKQRMK